MPTPKKAVAPTPQPKSSPAPPPAPQSPPAPQAAEIRSPRATIIEPLELAFTSSKATKAGDRIVVYGTGGIGKSTLCAYLPGAYFIDVERSTRKLSFEVNADTSVETWPQLRGKLAAVRQSPPKGMQSLIVDSFTRAEMLANEYVIETRRTEKGNRRVDSIEGFGWGKGHKFAHEEALGLLSDLERISDMGINVCLVCHDIDSPVPNPSGEDYIRWEPKAYPGDKKGNASTRAELKNWADHVVFLGYDVFVEDGKGTGSGTRQAHTRELPTHIAKSRSAQISIPFTAENPGQLWVDLGIS